jgi:hypothetical protein
MKKISIVLSVLMIGSNMVLPTSQYISSFAGIATADAARGARVTRRGPRGSVTRSAVAGPRGAAARTTVRTRHGSASRTVAAARPIPGRPIHRPVVRPVPVAPVRRAHARAHYHDRYDSNYYNSGAVLAAAVAGLAVGAMVASIPPSCSTVIRNGIEYKRCGNDYYQQSFNGSDVVYVVVPAP